MDSITICNMALMAAGIPPITSFDELNDNARLCKTFYPVLRGRVLRDHLWSFATTYCQLQQLNEESPDPEFPIVCSLPGDLIRIAGLQDDAVYKHMGSKILVQSLPATLLYIRTVDNADAFDPAFAEALQNLLSAEIVLSASRDIQQAQYFRNEYDRKLAIARSIDSQENSHALQSSGVNSTFIAARQGYRPGRRRSGVTFVQGNAGKQV